MCGIRSSFWRASRSNVSEGPFSVAEDRIFTRREVAFLRELVKAGAPFMVVGLASAALQGAPAVTQDIDLWFRDLADSRIRKALDKVGAVYIPPVGLNPP